MQRILSLLILLAALIPAHAQLDVSLALKRRIYLRGEAMEAVVTIRNNAGRDIVLRDEPRNPWFSFEINRGKDTPVPPYTPDYHNDPVTILAGETVERKLDLLKLYPVNELASYTVRAGVYFSDTKNNLVSNLVNVDVSEGRTIWSRSVGVPGSNEYHEVRLLTFQTPRELVLYARIEDQATAALLCTYPLGRLVGGATPMAELDNNNTLYAFHLTAQSQYALSKIGVNGEWLGQTLWSAPKGRAAVRKKPDGSMVVVGASRDHSKDPNAPPVPKISDRPVALPK